MKYYKDTDNNVHALDSEEFESLLPSGSVKITEAQATALLEGAPETPTEADARKDAQVEYELGTNTVRVLMEALIPAIQDGSINAITPADFVAKVKANRKAEL